MLGGGCINLIHLPPFILTNKNNHMLKLSKRHFWEWFKRNNKEYLTVDRRPKKEASYWLNELNAHLRAYFKFLGFTIVLAPNRSAVLTITVNGKVKHFPKVDAFVALAPEIPGWEITALQDPMPADFLLETQMEAAGIDPQELRFSFDDDNPASGYITVYHPLCTEENEPDFFELAWVAVYNLLGERSYGTGVRRLEVTNLSLANPEKLRKLDELPALLSSGGSPMVVDHKGKLIYRC